MRGKTKACLLLVAYNRGMKALFFPGITTTAVYADANFLL